MRVAGLISGTSVDGIDVAVVDIDDGIRVVAATTVPYPADVREAILSVSNAATHTAAIARLNFLLGELFAEAVRKTGVPLETIELIGNVERYDSNKKNNKSAGEAQGRRR